MDVQSDVGRRMGRWCGLISDAYIRTVRRVSTDLEKYLGVRGGGGRVKPARAGFYRTERRAANNKTPIGRRRIYQCQARPAPWPGPLIANRDTVIRYGPRRRRSISRHICSAGVHGPDQRETGRRVVHYGGVGRFASPKQHRRGTHHATVPLYWPIHALPLGSFLKVQR